MDTIPKQQPVIQPLKQEWYSPYVTQVDMLRLDIVHPIVSGNKWYKLKHNIEYALENSYQAILTFGGAYSNHLVATAAAAKQYGLKSIGVVRCIYAQENLTPTLQACVDFGMQLVFISREDYGRKDDDIYLQQLGDRFNRPFIIPEGGANELGRQGCAEIASYVTGDYTHVCVSVGTGTTFTGLRNALPPAIQLLGYAPMKGGSYLADEIIIQVNKSHNINWQLFDDWHFGGFGKWSDELIALMNNFFSQQAIPLDVVYTSKMMAGVKLQLQSGYFPTDARILCLHTGGLQGNASLQHRLIY